MSNETEVKDTEVEPAKILHKRGKGRPAPGELEPGEIGINTSTREDDNTIHNVDDTWIRSQPRAWTADDDGKLHAIGGWDSLEKSAMYGDIPYSLTWEGESLGKTLPSWQHMLYDLNAFREGTEAWKDDLGEDWREMYYPIPNGGTIDDIDFNEYASGRAALGVIPWHAEYEADVRVFEPKIQITARTCGSFNVDMEIHAKSIRLFTTSFQNNIPITVVETHTGAPFYGVHNKPDGTYNEFKDSQTIINGPTSDEHYKKWDELVEGSDEYKKCNTPLAYRTLSTAVLAVYGSSHVVGGGMRATHDEHPTEKLWGEDGKVITYTPEGSMYFNTVTKRFMGYEGTQWVELAKNSDDLAHTHDEYAPTDHSHDEYAPTNHSHDEYAPKFHSHDGLWAYEGGNSISHTGHVEVKGSLLSAQPDAGFVALSAGSGAGASNQGPRSVAVGASAGSTDQSEYATTIGYESGHTSQGWGALALGYRAAKENQGAQSVAVGPMSGHKNQGSKATALGSMAGSEGQGINASAIGLMAGEKDQGANSVAIGHKAGQTSQGANGIIISSAPYAVDDTDDGHIIIKSSATELRSLSDGSFAMNRNPIMGARDLIETLSTLRNATRDETTVEGLRDSIGNAIGGLIEKFESQIAATMEIPE